MSTGYIPIMPAPSADAMSVGNVSALLSEIETRLEILSTRREPGWIDLRSLPFSTQEREQLKALLGQGEVVAQIEALGPSEVVETGYAGVWWITHRNADGVVVAELIEVALVPDLLASQMQDIQASLSRLQSTIPRCRNMSEE